MTLRICLIALLALAGCAESKPADDTPAQDGGGYPAVDRVPTPPAVAGPEGTGGSWQEGEGDRLRFAAADGALLLTIGCHTRDGLVVERHRAPHLGETGMMTIAAGEMRRDLAVDPLQDPAGVQRAVIPYNDPLIALLVERPQSVAVTIEGAPRLDLPPSPLVPEKVRACQRSQAGG